LKKIKTLFFIVVIISSTACNDEYRLDSRDRTIVDTTAGKEFNKINIAMEDSTKKNFDRQVKVLTDSIVEYQLKAIEKQLNIPKKK
jgi:hypothetical protein